VTPVLSILAVKQVPVLPVSIVMIVMLPVITGQTTHRQGDVILPAELVGLVLVVTQLLILILGHIVLILFLEARPQDVLRVTVIRAMFAERILQAIGIVQYAGRVQILI